MELLIKNVILIVLLPLLEAQYNAQSSAFIPKIIKPKKQEHENKEILAATEEPITTTVFPPLRCLSCAYCSPKEGKTRNSEGKKMCPIKLGELNGCISIFFNFTNTAGGPHGFMVRSCLSDLDEGSREYCKKNEKYCDKCFDDDCNYVDITKDGLVTGGGTQIMASIILILNLIGWLLVRV
ncbi:uncharacterized protein [Drosophila takahashii]|uniref:uncharacterized protein n=1 Tax=Drosophila takahashii TaxID=29030 RepID=UPI001CF8E1AE|nr:uncharacterized protein LOC123003219 [Drosophila takahashii]